MFFRRMRSRKGRELVDEVTSTIMQRGVGVEGRGDGVLTSYDASSRGTSRRGTSSPARSFKSSFCRDDLLLAKQSKYNKDESILLFVDAPARDILRKAERSCKPCFNGVCRASDEPSSGTVVRRATELKSLRTSEPPRPQAESPSVCTALARCLCSNTDVVSRPWLDYSTWERAYRERANRRG